MRTDSYVMTADPRCSASMLELQTIRNAVKQINKEGITQFYVKCQGRWGKKNPNYNQRTMPFCPLEHANTMDVYIYKR